MAIINLHQPLCQPWETITNQWKPWITMSIAIINHHQTLHQPLFTIILHWNPWFFISIITHHSITMPTINHDSTIHNPTISRSTMVDLTDQYYSHQYINHRHYSNVNAQEYTCYLPTPGTPCTAYLTVCTYTMAQLQVNIAAPWSIWVLWTVKRVTVS